MRRLVLALLLVAVLGGATAAAAQLPGFESVAEIKLLQENDSGAKGRLTVYTKADIVAFELLARRVKPSPDDVAYGVWLVDGRRPHFLGFAPYFESDRTVRATGPRNRDQKHIRRWLRDAGSVLLTLETEPRPTAPGTAILRGNLSALEL